MLGRFASIIKLLSARFFTIYQPCGILFRRANQTMIVVYYRRGLAAEIHYTDLRMCLLKLLLQSAALDRWNITFSFRKCIANPIPTAVCSRCFPKPFRYKLLKKLYKKFIPERYGVCIETSKKNFNQNYYELYTNGNRVFNARRATELRIGVLEKKNEAWGKAMRSSSTVNCSMRTTVNYKLLFNQL